MESITDKSTCVFCRKFGEQSSGERKWFDTELTSLDNFIVIPGLGPFVEGWLLILTRQHYRNMAHLSTSQLAELTVLKGEVREVLARCYQAPIVFEHGPAVPRGSSAFPTSSGGSCIDHAHFQVLPLEVDLLPLLRMRHTMRRIEDLAELVGLSVESRPYIFYENQQRHMYVGEAESVPRQYLRRLIAEELGMPDDWHYAEFPNYTLIRATIERLRPWPSRDIETSRTNC